MTRLHTIRTAALLAALASATHADVVHYVRAGAAGAADGTSWADAFPELQSALAVALPGAEIWVAAGAYSPAAGGLDTLARFNVPSGVALLGGFAGTETTAAQRDPAAHVTTLTGDLLGDDDLGPNHIKDNSHKILHAEDTAEGTVIDGFTVRDANGSPGFAGALHVRDAFLRVRRCTFIDNDGDPGGILCGQTGSTVIEQCLFIDNRTLNWPPAIFCRAGHNVDVRDCRFLRNVGGTYGGALGVYQASGSASGCLFSGNRTGTFWGGGGAIYVLGSTFACSNTSFSGNETHTNGGGAALYVYDTVLRLSNCVMWGDVSETSMGGQDELAFFDVDLTLEHCLVEGFAGQFAATQTSGLDPLFVDADGPDDVFGTLDDDLSLLPGSPAIDSGTQAGVAADTLDSDCDGNTSEPAPLDLRRVNRFEDDPDTVDVAGQVAPVVDRGPFEFSRWTNLGHGLGDPCLIGTGSWKPGTPLSLVIQGTLPNAQGVLFVGRVALDAPFKGGVLVPKPQLGKFITTDALGQLVLPGFLPPDAPLGLETFLQAWFIDPAGPEGLSATNAVSGKTP